MNLEEKIKSVEQELRDLTETRNNLIKEKVKAEYSNTLWAYGDGSFFKVIEVKEVYVDSQCFSCSGLDVEISNEKEEQSFGMAINKNTEFGWGKQYSGWELVDKQVLLDKFKNICDHLEKAL